MVRCGAGSDPGQQSRPVRKRICNQSLNHKVCVTDWIGSGVVNDKRQVDRYGPVVSYVQ